MQQFQVNWEQNVFISSVLFLCFWKSRSRKFIVTVTKSRDTLRIFELYLGENNNNVHTERTACLCGDIYSAHLLPSCIRCPTTWTGWCVTWQTWKYSLAQSRGLTACSKLNQRITRDCSVSALCRLKLNFLLLIQQALREIMTNVLPEKCLWFLLEWRSLKLTLRSSLSVQEGCHNAHEKWIFIPLALFENSANVFYIP